MKNRLLLPAILFLMMATDGFGQTSIEIIYKHIDTVKLGMRIYRPADDLIKQNHPAIVFFFGGGWTSGTITHFEPQARYLAKRGMVAILVDYRVKSRNKTTPFESLMDAKSAMRYVRKHASELGIDPERIVASGGSAGGHLAAATAFIEGYNDPSDDLSVSCVPNALVLFNPVIDNGPGGYGFERIGKAYRDFSPLHNIMPGAPPTIFFLGTEDALIPVETAKYYQTLMEKVGSRCELRLYPGGKHGFFNPQFKENYKSTLKETDQFLQSLGYLPPQRIRNVVDTVGFAQYDWQMDSIISRLSSRIHPDPKNIWKAAIAPHDDYKYAGELTYEALSGIHCKTIILFGVAHKARSFNLENQLVFGSYTHWAAPYGNIPISALQDEILKRLPQNLWLVHDSMQMVEHSLEALTPFLQYQDRDVEIIPILVPAMDFNRMNEISESFSKVLADILHEKGLIFGKDVAIVISNDALHYGDVDWGGRNMAPFGTDKKGNAQAGKLDHEIIDNCLKGPITEKKINRFVGYTVQKSDFREYKWTWCGRYAVPMGLLTANKLNERLFHKPIKGHFLHYASSIDHPLYPVEDLRMGITAIATPRHWVSYVGMGYD